MIVPEFISPWWIGTDHGDHFYWYCPERAGEIPKLTANGTNLVAHTYHGLQTADGGVCGWCLIRYVRTVPRTESDHLDYPVVSGSSPVRALKELHAARV